MNDQLQTYARDTLKEGLAQCSDSEQLIFKRMYSHGNLDLPIDEVVDLIPPDSLDWAMEQVRKTIDKRNKGDK